MSKKYKDRYLPVEVIIAATQGEAAAIQTVLKTYESYIRNKCIKTVYDEKILYETFCQILSKKTTSAICY